MPPYHSSVSPNPQPGAPTESLAAFFRHSAPKRAHQLSATCRLSRILRPSCYYASVASGAQQRTTTATGRCCYCCRLCRCYSVLLPTSGSAANSHQWQTQLGFSSFAASNDGGKDRTCYCCSSQAPGGPSSSNIHSPFSLPPLDTHTNIPNQTLTHTHRLTYSTLLL